MAKRKNITTTQLALMTAAAVISLRGLPMMAQEELTMFFYIFFATFLFLIPTALVGAELGSAFADRGGGVYTWVKEAFNPPPGFLGDLPAMDSERRLVSHRTGIRRRVDRLHDRRSGSGAERAVRRVVLDCDVLVRDAGDPARHVDHLGHHLEGISDRHGAPGRRRDRDGGRSGWPAATKSP